MRRARLGKEAGGNREKCVRPMGVVPDDEPSAKAWLNAIFPIHREWDGLTLTQMFPLESKGKRLMHVVVTELTNLRDQIAHSIMHTGKLSLSADDLVQIQRVNKWVSLTRRIARRTTVRTGTVSNLDMTADSTDPLYAESAYLTAKFAVLDGSVRHVCSDSFPYQCHACRRDGHC